MHLVGMVNPPTSQYAENWRDPLGRADWLSGRFHADLARTLERGLFDMAFFADALAVPEDGDGDYATTLRTAGKGSIYLDPITVVSLAAGATSRIGLGATVSTSFVPPYAIARQLLSVDHLSGGRAAWNIVTSTTDAEARNMGRDRIDPPGERYDRADAVVQTVLDLWRSWEPGALVHDRESGLFADPKRVHRVPGGLSRGPLTLPRSPQGHPVLMQAGSSPRGRAFAARWAEVVFAIGDTEEGMRELRRELRDRARIDHDRDPDSIRVLQGVQPVVGWTDADAQAKLRALRERIDLPAALTKLARLLHADELDPDAPAVDALAAHRGATGSVGFEDMLASVSARRGFTVAELAVEQALNQLHPQVVGSPATVAEHLEHLFRGEAADGFVVFPALYHSSFEDFVAGVVPELQRRGVFRTEYSGATLREHLRG
ncbi:LLM class flavin-dependent oxidoreductase [Leucobacter triazinivorans]|uniref:LLM class flavin-dependent oxidoreductase n=2 Tax=Leucobacter triazinivorans TaxID=1784719 RepID=A0A4P6KIF7_9MICO|nr:LLM class flavin-dependent oxidoreductase [Leucobacter triazinivorans]